MKRRPPLNNNDRIRSIISWVVLFALLIGVAVVISSLYKKESM